MATPKLLKFGTPALQNIIRHHIISPSAAVAATHLFRSTTAIQDAPISNSFQLEKEGTTGDSLKLNLTAASNLQLLFNSSVPRIELARTYVPSDAVDKEDDFCDDLDDDEVADDDDDEIDDDDDEDEDEDVAEDVGDKNW